MKVFRFRPILKQTLWGGEKIAAMKGLTDAPAGIGESWEVSGVEGDVSVVDGGDCDGMTLTALIDKMQGTLVGDDVYRRYGTRFPLLIKFIDAQRDLSIQVHPTDAQAQAAGRPCGKTEMWVIMRGSSADASLRVGLNRAITPDEYRRMVADSTIVDTIARYPVGEGDCFFLPAGRIHSIGAGCLLLEIQQTSDVTYRIFDFNRRDKDGRLRQLHTDEAAAAIDYRVESDYRTYYEPKKNETVRLVDCPYFTTDILSLDGRKTLDLAARDSFTLLMAVDGEGSVQADDETPVALRRGQTLLVAAATRTLMLDGQVKVVTATVGT